MIPESIKVHQPKYTEIRHKNGHYYVLLVKAYYDKETHKSKRRSLGIIGQIYEGIGYVPNRQKTEPINTTKEYGATRLIMANSEDVFEKLRAFFPSDFMRIYVIAVLKLLDNCSFDELSDAYRRSSISLLLPTVHVSENTASDFLEYLSLQRENMLNFMKSFGPFNNDTLIFDGTCFTSSSVTNPYCNKGYTPGIKNKTQIRLIYAYNTKTKQPIYFKVAPGNSSDKIILSEIMQEIQCDKTTIILDKGFLSASNIVLLSKVKFIIPLLKNTKLVSEDMKSYRYSDHCLDKFFYYNNRVIFYTESTQNKFANTKIYVFYDYDRREQLKSNYYAKLNCRGNSIPDEIKDEVFADVDKLGVSLLLANVNQTPQEIYYNYKTRWEIEEMFDTHKNTLGFKMKYETKYKIQEGWSFIEFIALLIYHKINALLLNVNLISQYNVAAILKKLSIIEKTSYENKWHIYNLTEPLKKLISQLNLTLVPPN